MSFSGIYPNDTLPYPNTLPIRSLLKVNFWVFHPRDLTPFLIHLSRVFTFHHHFVVFVVVFFFPFISCNISTIFIFLYTTMMHMKCNEITYHHPQYKRKLLLIQISIKKHNLYLILFILNNLNNFNNQTL